MATELSRSRFGTSIGVMTSHAGAASAPVAPRENVVASNTAGVAQCKVTMDANTMDIAVTASCTPIRSPRESTMSASTPAGNVIRNIGSVVATWTAETIIGSGLRLVISQLIDVSNIANPTFDAELAIRMTVNAKLPNTPQRHSRPAGASDLTLNSLDKKRPRRKNERGTPRLTLDLGGERRAEFQGGAAVRRRRHVSEKGPDNGKSFLID